MDILGLESNTQKDLDVLLEWCHKWRININIKKTEVIASSGEKTHQISILKQKTTPLNKSQPKEC